jgi:hypothetical protein
MSDLARQLRHLQRPTLAPKARASLLFDVLEAAKIDREIIYTIGINGLEELRSYDSSLCTFYSDLFQEDQANRYVVRDELTESQLESLDAEVKRVLEVLCPYFLVPSAHKVYEFLIRFYHVHEYHVQTLLTTLLPYHDHKIFVRLLQLLAVKDTVWEFLGNHKDKGCILLRADLVKKCVKDLNFLSLLISVDKVSPRHMRFVTVVLLEVIHACPRLSDAVMHVVLPAIASKLEGDAEEKMAAYLVISQVVLKQALSPAYLQAVMFDIVRLSQGAELDAVKCLLVLCKVHVSSRQDLKALPTNVFEEFAQERLVSSLGQLSQSVIATPLIVPLVKRLLAHYVKTGDRSLPDLLISSSRLELADVDAFVKAILTQAVTAKKSKHLDFTGLLSQVSLRYLEQVTQSLPGAIKEVRESHKGSKVKQMLHKIVVQGLSGCPFDKEAETPLVLSLSHYAAEVRSQAIKQLPADLAGLESLVLLRLKIEDHYEVLKLLVSADLSTLPAAELFSELKTRLVELLGMPLFDPDLLELVASVTLKQAERLEISAEHIETLLRVYEVDALRHLSSQAAKSFSRHPLFLNYRREDLKAYLTQELLADWETFHPLIFQLRSVPVISQVLVSVLDALSRHSASQTPVFCSSLSCLTDLLLQDPSDNLETYRAIVRAIPALPEVAEAVDKAELQQTVLKVLQVFISASISDALELLSRHIREDTLSVLCALFTKESVSLACRLNSPDLPNFVQVFPYLLTSLTCDKPFRENSLSCISAWVKQRLPSVTWTSPLRKTEEIEKCAGVFKLVSIFASKLIKHKTSILNDKEFVTQALQQVYRTELEPYFLAAFQGLLTRQHAYPTYRHPSQPSSSSLSTRVSYIRAFKGVVSDSLTSGFLSLAKDEEETLEALKRLEILQDWGKLNIEAYLTCLDTQALCRTAVLPLTAARFAQLDEETKGLILVQLVRTLSRAQPPLSTDLHMKVEELQLGSVLLAELLKSAEQPQELEVVLEVVNYKHEEASPALLTVLFEVLRRLVQPQDYSKVVGSSKPPTKSRALRSKVPVEVQEPGSRQTEYLKQLALAAIKAHYESLKDSFKLTKAHLETVVASMTWLDEFSIQTRHQGFLTLASFAHSVPFEVAGKLAEVIEGVQDLKFELVLYRAAASTVVPILVAQSVNLVGFLEKYVASALKDASLDLLKELISAIRGFGEEYLPHAVLFTLPRSLEIAVELVRTFGGLAAINTAVELIDITLKPFTQKTRKAPQLDQSESLSVIKFVEQLFLNSGVVTDLASLPSISAPLSVLIERILKLVLHARKLVETSKDKKPAKLFRAKVLEMLGRVNHTFDHKSFAEAAAFILGGEEKGMVEVKRELIDCTAQRLSDPAVYAPIQQPLLQLLSKYQTKVFKPKEMALANYVKSALELLRAVSSDDRELLTTEGHTVLAYCQSSVLAVKLASVRCFAGLFSEPDPQVLPHVETLSTALVELLDSQDKDTIAEAEVVLKELVRKIPQYLAPHLKSFILALCRVKSTALNETLTQVCRARLLLGPLTEAYQETVDPEAFGLLFSITEAMTARLSNKEIAHFREYLQEFFLIIAQYAERQDQDAKLIENIDIIAKAFTHFGAGLTESQLRGVFIDIYQWAIEKNSEKRYSWPRLYLMYSIVLSLTRQLKALFTSFFSLFHALTLELLGDTAKAYSSTKKRPRDSSELLELNTVVLATVKLSAVYDKGSYFTNDVYDRLTTAVVEQFSMVGLADAYDAYAESHLRPCLTDIIKSTMDETVWKGINFKLLLTTRSPHSSVRLQCFKCLSQILNAVGERYAALLSDIMPFVTEGLEDTHEAISGAALQVLRQLEALSGENLKEHLV